MRAFHNVRQNFRRPSTPIALVATILSPLLVGFPLAVAQAPREPGSTALPPPLVESPDKLLPLDPDDPVWLTPDRKQVVLQGVICQRKAPLELFACRRNSKEHESIVSVAVKPYVVHAGLLATGGKPGSPAIFYPEFEPARGTEIDVQVRWQDAEEKTHQARAQDWVLNIQTDKAMENPWVFAGSRFFEDEETGEKFYLADRDGEIICVANFPGAILDVPIKSSDAAASLLYHTFTERIPPLGTPVTLILTPQLDESKNDASGSTSTE